MSVISLTRTQRVVLDWLRELPGEVHEPVIQARMRGSRVKSAVSRYGWVKLTGGCIVRWPPGTQCGEVQRVIVDVELVWVNGEFDHAVVNHRRCKSIVQTRQLTHKILNEWR